MRRAIGFLTFPLMSAIASAALAQGTEFGVKAGPSFAVVTIDPNVGQRYNRRTGIGGGAFVVVPLRRSVGLQLEGLLLPQGAKADTGGGVDTSKLLLDYFVIPVLARFDVPRSHGLHVFGGPYMGFRLKAKTETANTFGGVTAGEHQDISDQIKAFEMGLVGGAGVNIGQWVVVDARYTRGLTNVNSDSGDPVRVKNETVTVLAGLRFRVR